MDRERAQGGPRGPLHGIPVVVKDTIDVAGMPTTGGFTALAESRPLRDAAAIRRLHDAGAVVLAKVNANDWFGKAPMSASTLGGQTLNPHHLDYVPGGSSCGTGAARDRAWI
ncbi:MAG: amidase family protein [Spirochaetaceae bacterium]|nr:amidase family protein [Spirochaetaceae bacterium]MDE0448297.1 amidase family protein [Spirochaetaceae bacterium]